MDDAEAIVLRVVVVEVADSKVLELPTSKKPNRSQFSDGTYFSGLRLLHFKVVTEIYPQLVLGDNFDIAHLRQF